MRYRPPMYLMRYNCLFKKQHTKRYETLTQRFSDKFTSFEDCSTGSIKTEYCVLTSRDLLIPTKFMWMVRKLFRKFFKSKRIGLVVTFTTNSMVSYKGKNARMGKGAGSRKRFCSRLPSKSRLFVLRSCSHARVEAFVKLLNKRLKSRLFVSKSVSYK